MSKFLPLLAVLLTSHACAGSNMSSASIATACIYNDARLGLTVKDPKVVMAWLKLKRAQIKGIVAKWKLTTPREMTDEVLLLEDLLDLVVRLENCLGDMAEYDEARIVIAEIRMLARVDDVSVAL